MTTPRIRTIAESTTRWWLLVGDGAELRRFGPFKKAGRAKWLEDHLRKNAQAHGWTQALRAGEGEVLGVAPVEPQAVQAVQRLEQLGLAESGLRT